jgi:hypothetical protein
MSHIPIDKQLRAHGMRRAMTGEDALVVCLSYRGESIAVQAVQVPNLCDPIVVVVLRGFAAMFWARHPELSIASVRVALCSHSEMIGATDAELTQASLKLELVRE